MILEKLGRYPALRRVSAQTPPFRGPPFLLLTRRAGGPPKKHERELKPCHMLSKRSGDLGGRLVILLIILCEFRGCLELVWSETMLPGWVQN